MSLNDRIEHYKARADREWFFFLMNNIHCVGLAFGDVRLKSDYSDKMPNELSIESHFSNNVPLKTPIVSAAMDTVTEYKMAIEIAKLGGLGIIHKNMSPEEQAHQVAKVKFYLNGLIEKPICVQEDETIEQILNKRDEKGYTFHCFPVIDSSGKLTGILTENDFDFCENYSLRAKDVMTSELITADVGTDINTAYRLMRSEKKKSLPIVKASGEVAGLYVFSDVKRIMLQSSPLYNTDDRGQLRVGAAIGVDKDALIRLEKLMEEHVDVVVIDTAHADSLPVKISMEELTRILETKVKEVKKSYDIDVVVGNISEPWSAERLCKAGADGVKVGQGPGSTCLTRVVAGIGCPQVTAVYNCAKVCDRYKVKCNADGGIEYSGDIPIAIAAGANSVMIGGLLAGTDEAPGDVILHEGRRWKYLRGMGSLAAMAEHKGSRDRYQQQDEAKSRLVPEGVEGLVPYRGAVSDVMKQLVGGLRKGMGYTGKSDIDELRTLTRFRRMTSAGQQESHPHSMTITQEPPNYDLKR